MYLSGIYIHPVKSLGGYAVETCDVDALGLAGDRRYMVVDEAGRFLTQRTLPLMALVETKLTSSALILSRSGHDSIEVSNAKSPERRPVSVSVWNSAGLIAEDCGDEPATWLSAALGRNCRLVRAGSAFHRPVKNADRMQPEALVSFADAYPMLAIGEASLAELNDRLVARNEEAIPMNRFRPNLVITGAAPFAEDRWQRFRINDVIFQTAGPCARCIVITTNQHTGERGQEPLRTLASYRRDPADSTQINFGQNLVHETKSGILRVGDRIERLD
jgi:uncharacterized protein YcbX